MNRLTIGCLALITVLFVASPALPQAGAQNTSRKIDVGDFKLRAQIEGQPVEGQPTVVLVGGLGDGLEIWKLVQPAVAQFARVVAYDRAGIGQSDPDSAPATPQREAAQLQTLLQNAGIKPPYVLVGHSIGGAYVRMFAGLYPGEVAGLVFVDPTDFTQTRADLIAIWTELGPGEAGLNAYEKDQAERFAQQHAQDSPGARAEAEVAILQLPKTGFEEFRSLPPLPDVPVVILMATRSDMPPAVKQAYGKQRLCISPSWRWTFRTDCS